MDAMISQQAWRRVIGRESLVGFLLDRQEDIGKVSMYGFADDSGGDVGLIGKKIDCRRVAITVR